MGKDKAKLQQQRAAKRSEKSKERKALQKGKGPRPDPAFTGSVSESLFSESDRLFWVAHGVNCLLSNYKEGTWTPLFEGIYANKIPNNTEISAGVMEHYAGQKEWPSVGKAALAWTVSSPKLLYIYWLEATRRMQRAHPELDAPEVVALIKKPANGLTWDLFHYLCQHMLARKAI